MNRLSALNSVSQKLLKAFHLISCHILLISMNFVVFFSSRFRRHPENHTDGANAGDGTPAWTTKETFDASAVKLSQLIVTNKYVESWAIVFRNRDLRFTLCEWGLFVTLLCLFWKFCAYFENFVLILRMLCLFYDFWLNFLFYPVESK